MSSKIENHSTFDSNISVRKIINNGLGERIKEIRNSLGLTLEEFGEQFSPPATKGAVWQWENKNVRPSEERLTKIAELGSNSRLEDITVEYLLTGKRNIDYDVGITMELEYLSDYAKKLDKESYNLFRKGTMNALGIIKMILERSLVWENEVHDISEIDGHQELILRENLELFSQINHNLFQIISPLNSPEEQKKNAQNAMPKLLQSINNFMDNSNHPAEREFH